MYSLQLFVMTIHHFKKNVHLKNRCVYWNASLQSRDMSWKLENMKTLGEGGNDEINTSNKVSKIINQRQI